MVSTAWGSSDIPLSEHEVGVHVCGGRSHDVAYLLCDHPQLFKIHKTLHTVVVPCRRDAAVYSDSLSQSDTFWLICLETPQKSSLSSADNY